MGDQPGVRRLPTQGESNTKQKQTDVLASDPTMPVFDREKAVRAAAVIGRYRVPISMYKSKLVAVEVIRVEGKVATYVNGAVRKCTLPDVLFRNASCFVLSYA
jgi:hypothetical protein